MKKRILALLLAAVMVLGLMPTALAATKTFDDFFEGLPVTAETEPGSSNSTNKWKVTTLNGEDVLMSGNKGKAYGSSTLQLTFTSDTQLTFDYKVSTEEKYDKLTIKLGGTTLVNGVSGVIDWTTLEVDAKQGNVLTIVYTKDVSGDGHDDAVYVRNFSAGTPAVVTLHANNGTDTTDTQKIYNGKGTLKANAFTCEGKVFAGWATSADGEIVYSDGAVIETEADMDLYAVWGEAFTVTFVYDDGKTENTSVQTAQNAPFGSVNIPAATKKTGYNFGGWFHGETQLTAQTVITQDTTFTAKWTPITYKIEFSGGSDAEGSVDAIESVSYDQDVTLPENGFTRAGYTFNGWSTSSSSASGYQPGSTVKNLSSKDGATVTLYAAWKALRVQVTLHYNDEREDLVRYGAVGSNYNYAEDENGNLKFNSISDQTRTGYIFDGWFNAAEGGEEISMSYKFTASDAENGFHMYAHWTKGITVHFDGNGYKNAISDKTVKPDAVYTSLPYTTSYFYPDNKAFDGWYIKNADGSFGEAVTASTSFEGLEEVTLIAKWRDYQYIIKYNLRYSDKTDADHPATGTMADQPAPFGQDVKLAKCTFERSGYTFKGWAESSYATASTTYYDDEAVINREWDDSWDGSEDNEPFTLYAFWTESSEPADPVDEEANTKLAAALAAIKGTYNAAYGTDTNALDMIQAKLTAAGIADVTVRMKEAVSSSYNYVGIAADGTLQYKWNENGTTPAAAGSVYASVVLSYTGSNNKEYTKESDNCLFYMGLDEAKAMAALNAVADRIAALVPENVESAADLTSLPKYALKAGQTDYSDSSNVELWTTAAWQSGNTAVLAVTEDNAGAFTAPYKVTVTLPKNDTNVTLTLKLVYNGREDDLYLNRVYTVTVKGDDTPAVIDYNKVLEEALAHGLTNPATGDEIDRAQVTGDIQFPTTRDLNTITMRDYEEGFDGKYTPILITSSNEDVISSTDVANAARVVVYRPLPGEEAATVTVTMKILARPSGEGTDYSGMEVLGQKSVELTVQPMSQDEIDAAEAFMTKVCTEEVYWEGMKKANTDKEHVTGDLYWFFEIDPDTTSENGYKFIRSSDAKKNIGVVVDDIPGWYDTQSYRIFRSSNSAIIAHENLLVTQPKYNKNVTIDSVLTYAEYGKYYEKDAAKYAAFAKFYKQPVSVTVTVIGTEGVTDPSIKTYTATVSIEGNAFNSSFVDLNTTYTCSSDENKTAFDAISKVLTDSSYSYVGSTYVSSVTSNTGATLSGGDAAYGSWSGWMYTVNGGMPILDAATGTYARLDQYEVQDKDVIRLYYVACPSETGHHVVKEGTEQIVFEATCTENGKRTYQCAVCPDTITEVIPAAHKWGEVEYTWSQDNTACTATRTCAGSCKQTQSMEGVVETTTTPATCLAEGNTHYTATFTGDTFQTETQTKDVTLKKLPHTEVVDAAVPATCTVDGKSEGKHCSVCNTVLVAQQTIKALGHAWDNGVVIERPTYTSTGTKLYTCTRTDCGATKTETLPKLTHSSSGSSRPSTNKPAAKDPRPSEQFKDVVQGRWYCDAIDYVVERKLFTGTSYNTFSPNEPTTRAMLVTVLHRLAGTPAVSGTHGFQDTKQEGWYADAVTWATKNGIVEGLGNGNFAPDAAITREQLVSILYRYAKSCGYNVSASADLTAYQDNADVSAWARDAMRWAVGCGLISGRSATKLAPRESATRAEVAVMLMNFMKLIAK